MQLESPSQDLISQPEASAVNSSWLSRVFSGAKGASGGLGTSIKYASVCRYQRQARSLEGKETISSPSFMESSCAFNLPSRVFMRAFELLVLLSSEFDLTRIWKDVSSKSDRNLCVCTGTYGRKNRWRRLLSTSRYQELSANPPMLVHGKTAHKEHFS